MTNISQAIIRLREERHKALQQVEQLGEAISALEKLTRGSNARTATASGVKRALSAAGRRRISLAQKARWAKIRQLKKAA